MTCALVPELAVSDWQQSRRFYCEVLGFSCAYDRADEGFSYLCLGAAELMIDQIGLGRDFDDGHLPDGYPFGRGLNLQIEVPDIGPLLAGLDQVGHPLLLPVEDKWYRTGSMESGNRQFVVADPDGYLLRFFQDLGTRPAACFPRVVPLRHSAKTGAGRRARVGQADSQGLYWCEQYVNI